MVNNMDEVTIYTDGACSGNPGPGGWAAVLLYGDNKKEISGVVQGNSRIWSPGFFSAFEENMAWK